MLYETGENMNELLPGEAGFISRTGETYAEAEMLVAEEPDNRVERSLDILTLGNAIKVLAQRHPNLKDYDPNEDPLANLRVHDGHIPDDHRATAERRMADYRAAQIIAYLREEIKKLRLQCD
jgi:hypothetical protein